jgi:hypothetical protein
MSKFIFRASIETETAKQDKTHRELLEVLADHILAMTDKKANGARLVVFHRRFVAQTYCEKGADLRVQFTDQVRSAWLEDNIANKLMRLIYVLKLAISFGLGFLSANLLFMAMLNGLI